MDSYSSSIEQQTSLDRQELPGSMEQTSMARSQSAPMLDDDLVFPGHGSSNQNQLGQNQKPAVPHKAYHFDQNYNPQVSIVEQFQLQQAAFFWKKSSEIPLHTTCAAPNTEGKQTVSTWHVNRMIFTN